MVINECLISGYLRIRKYHDEHVRSFYEQNIVSNQYVKSSISCVTFDAVFMTRVKLIRGRIGILDSYFIMLQ